MVPRWVRAPRETLRQMYHSVQKETRRITMRSKAITAACVEILRKHFIYDPDSGTLIPQKADCCSRLRPNRAVVGSVHRSTGYMYLNTSHGLRPLYHRAVWAVVRGEIPANMEIDHINGDRSDNHIENLRIVTTKGNQQNRRVAQSNSKTGVLGVCFEARTGRYTASIVASGKKTHIGTFPTAQEAHNAYIEAKRRLHSTCTL